MSRAVTDLTGRVFGYRTVVRYHGVVNGASFWECRCSCGKLESVRASALKSGKAQSCGCLVADNAKARNLRRRIDPWLAEMNSYAYHVAWDRLNKNKAHKTWALTLDHFKALCTSSCFYCGAPPGGYPGTKSLRTTGTKRGGIDRRINSKGYEISNCVPCCTTCNKDKGTMRMCDFVEKTMRRYEHMKAHNWLQPNLGAAGG